MCGKKVKFALCGQVNELRENLDRQTWRIERTGRPTKRFIIVPDTNVGGLKAFLHSKELFCIVKPN